MVAHLERMPGLNSATLEALQEVRRVADAYAALTAMLNATSLADVTKLRALMRVLHEQLGAALDQAEGTCVIELASTAAIA